MFQHMGDLLDEQAQAHLDEVENQQAEEAANQVVRNRLAQAEALKRQDYTARRAKQLTGEYGAGADQKAYETDVAQQQGDLEKFGTPDTMSQRRLAASGGIYDDPSVLHARMQNDPEALRAELENQAGIRPSPKSGEKIYEGTGANGERYFTNSKEISKEAIDTGKAAHFKNFAPTTGGGGFSVIGGGIEDKKKHHAEELLKQLDATPAGEVVVERDTLKHKDAYLKAAGEVGAYEMSQQLEADALAGKVPMHVVKPIQRELASGSKVFLTLGEDAGGIPPTRQYAEQAKAAREKVAQRQMAEQAANDNADIKEGIERTQTGGMLKKNIDGLHELVDDDTEVGEAGSDELLQSYLNTRTMRSPSERALRKKIKRVQ